MTRPVYISTSNDYLKVLRISLRVFQKFWKNFDSYPVTVLGYRPPDYSLPSNVKFVSMGEQTGGPSMWSSDLRKIFENVEEYFIYMMDDMFMRSEVNEDLIERLTRLMVKDNLSRASLINDAGPFTGSTLYQRQDGIDFVQMLPTANYRNSTQPSIWHKEYLLKFLKPGLTPWQFEVKGSEEAKNDGKTVIGTRGTYAMDVFEGVRIPPRGRGPHSPYVELLPAECLEDLKKEGIL